MLFQTNPSLYLTQQIPFPQYAEAMNALYSSKMQSLRYNIIYNANALNGPHRIRISPVEAIRCRYYMEALSYYLAMSNPLLLSSNQSMPFSSSFTQFQQQQDQKQQAYDITTTAQNSTLNSVASKEGEEEDPGQQELLDLFREFYPNKRIGTYDWRTRVMKIIKYKMKQIKKQDKKPVVTKYSGRSKVASLKARYRGRFIKTKQLPEDSSH